MHIVFISVGFSLSVLTAIFQVNLGQLVPIEAKDDGGGGDNWTTGAVSRAKLQPTHHHQQTYIQFFTGWVPFLLPNQHCQSTEGKNITFHGLAYPELTWGLPTLSLTTNSSWLPWGRVVMPLIRPLMLAGYAKTTRSIFTKCSGKVAHGPRKKPLDLW